MTQYHIWEVGSDDGMETLTRLTSEPLESAKAEDAIKKYAKDNAGIYAAIPIRNVTLLRVRSRMTIEYDIPGQDELPFNEQTDDDPEE